MEAHPDHTFDLYCWCADVEHDVCTEPARRDDGPCLCCGLYPAPVATPVWEALT